MKLQRELTQTEDGVRVDWRVQGFLDDAGHSEIAETAYQMGHDDGYGKGVMDAAKTVYAKGGKGK